MENVNKEACFGSLLFSYVFTLILIQCGEKKAAFIYEASLGDMDVNRDTFGLEQSVKVLKKYAWIYNFAVVDVLVHGVFDTMDYTWKEILANVTSQDLNSMASGKIEASVTETLRILKSARITPEELKKNTLTRLEISRSIGQIS
jgi:hypothetical protein